MAQGGQQVAWDAGLLLPRSAVCSRAPHPSNRTCTSAAPVHRAWSGAVYDAQDGRQGCSCHRIDLCTLPIPRYILCVHT